MEAKTLAECIVGVTRLARGGDLDAAYADRVLAALWSEADKAGLTEATRKLVEAAG